MRAPRKFANNIDKVKKIMSVFNGGERLSGDEIAERLRKIGYSVNGGHIKMFIRYRMLYRHLKKDMVDRKVYYSPIGWGE